MTLNDRPAHPGGGRRVHGGGGPAPLAARPRRGSDRTGAAACARALIVSERIDAAVLDIHVAGELVFPTADALNERRIPFLFMSGFDRSIIPARFAHVQLLEKPILVEPLLQAMAGLLGT